MEIDFLLALLLFMVLTRKGKIMTFTLLILGQNLKAEMASFG